MSLATFRLKNQSSSCKTKRRPLPTRLSSSLFDKAKIPAPGRSRVANHANWTSRR